MTSGGLSDAAVNGRLLLLHFLPRFVFGLVLQRACCASLHFTGYISGLVTDMQASVCHNWVPILEPDTMQHSMRTTDTDAASNVPLFERSFGHPFWKHLQDTPGLDAAFSAAMSDQTHGLHGEQTLL